MSTETPTESPAQEAIQHIKAVSNMMRAAKDEKTAQTICSLNWTLLEGEARTLEAELARLYAVEAEYHLTASWAIKQCAAELAAGGAR